MTLKNVLTLNGPNTSPLILHRMQNDWFALLMKEDVSLVMRGSAYPIIPITTVSVVRWRRVFTFISLSVLQKTTSPRWRTPGRRRSWRCLWIGPRWMAARAAMTRRSPRTTGNKPSESDALRSSHWLLAPESTPITETESFRCAVGFQMSQRDSAAMSSLPHSSLLFFPLPPFRSVCPSDTQGSWRREDWECRRRRCHGDGSPGRHVRVHLDRHRRAGAGGRGRRDGHRQRRSGEI